MAERIARETPGAFFINQFGNPANPLAHETGTGPEILRADGRQRRRDRGRRRLGRHADRPVALLRAACRRRPNWCWPIRSARSSPNTSTTARSRPSPGAGWSKASARISCPPISDFSRVKKAYAISDKESFVTARELLAKEGILGGSSTGTLLAAALRYCREQTEPKRVVDLRLRHRQQVPVEGLQRLLDARPGLARARAARRPARPDLAPVRAARHRRGRPDDMLVTAYNRMQLYDVSQLPVLDGDKLVGMLDESDLLLHVDGDEARFRDPVSTAMVDQAARARRETPIEALLPMFDARPGGDRDRRREVPRPDHPHRPAQPPARRVRVTGRLGPMVECHAALPGENMNDSNGDASKPSRPGLGTRAIHAGQSPDPQHRRGDGADLRHLDLRAGEPGRAQGLRVLAHAQPDPLGLRALRRRPGRRRARLRLRLRPGRDRAPCSTCSTAATTSSRSTTSTAAPSGCSSGCAGARPGWTSASST